MTTHPDEYVVDFQVLTYGAMHVSVCSSFDEETTTAKLNLVHPTGIAFVSRLMWTPAGEDRFPNGLPNPCKCELRPDTHVHRLYSC